jgi:glycosyltransferase involved in cell wall biosynthesis
MMKIALVIPYNPLEEVGGLELSTVRYASSLIKAGMSATIITKGLSGSKAEVPVVGLGNYIELCRYLLVHESEFDVIHWLEIFPDPGEVELQGMMSGVLRSFGKKIVLMIATSGNLRNRGTGYLATPLLKNTIDAYVVSNPEQLNELAESNIRDNIHIIGFGVDTQNVFIPADQSQRMAIRKALCLPQNKVLCLFVGRFVERKRPDFLLRCWQQLSDIYDKAELVVVGSGMNQHDSIENSLSALAAETTHVSFRDITDNPESYYQCCDMLLLPSSREGQPNVLMEMMACGNPVIGSDIAGIRELLVHEKTGLLFQPHDIEQFGRHIRALIFDSELRSRLGNVAREIIVKEKNQNTVLKQYIQLYEKL